MRSLRVVHLQPFLRDLPDLGQRGEDPRVEHLGAVRLVEALDNGVLVRFPRLDVMQQDPVRLTLGSQRRRDQFRAVVTPQPCRGPVQRHQLPQQLHYPPTRQRGTDLDRQRFPIAFVQHVKRPVAAPVVQRIAHEIERPRPVQDRWGFQRQPRPSQHPLLPPALEVEVQRAVHAIHPLPVPAMAQGPQAIKAEPEAPSAVPIDQRHRRADHRLVVC